MSINQCWIAGGYVQFVNFIAHRIKQDVIVLPTGGHRGIFVDTRRGIECKSERHRSNIAPGQSPVSEYINMRLIIVPQAISIDRVSLPSSNGSCPIVPISVDEFDDFLSCRQGIGICCIISGITDRTDFPMSIEIGRVYTIPNVSGQNQMDKSVANLIISDTGMRTGSTLGDSIGSGKRIGRLKCNHEWACITIAEKITVGNR